MKQTATLNKTNLTIDRIVLWEDNAQYDGSVYITSEKGASYLGFIQKGTNRVAVYKMSNSGGKSFKGYIEIELPKKQSDAEWLEEKIVETYGNKVEAEIVENGVILKFKSNLAAQKMLRIFRRHQPTIHAHDYLNYSMFIPVKARLLLNE